MEIIHLVLVSVYFIFYLLAKTGFWQRYETEELLDSVLFIRV